MEAIGSGPLSQLFVLMLMPLVGAILLGGLIVYFYTRRRKKSKMKHGLETNPVPEDPLPSGSDTPEIDTDNLSDTPAPPPASSHQVASNDDSVGLDLGLLGKGVDEPEDKPAVPLQNVVNPAPSSEPSPSPPTPPTSEPAELLRLLRHPQSGQLIVEIAGQRYVKLADITDKRIGQFILQLTAHLLAFTNGMIVTHAGMKSVYKPKVGETPQPFVSSSAATQTPNAPATPTQKSKSETSADAPTVSPAPPETKADFLASLQDSSHQQTEPVPPTGGLLGRVAQPSPPPPSIPGLNLAEEINDIVQARLRYSPLAETTSITITSDLSGGIRIEVNGQFYSSPDDVPDPEAKKLIKASIKEWERS